jgi:hypothetical protein
MKWDQDCKQEEEQQKQAEAEKRKAKEAAVTAAPVVSPMTQMEINKADPSIKCFFCFLLTFAKIGPNIVFL